MAWDTFALRWFTEMQGGRFDRTQLTDAYSAQLTDGAVQVMSRHLNEYGVPPKSAEILRSRTVGDQKFHLVKLVFPAAMRPALLSAPIRTARSPASFSRAWRVTDRWGRREPKAVA